MLGVVICSGSAAALHGQVPAHPSPLLGRWRLFRIREKAVRGAVRSQSWVSMAPDPDSSPHCPFALESVVFNGLVMSCPVGVHVIDLFSCYVFNGAFSFLLYISANAFWFLFQFPYTPEVRFWSLYPFSFTPKLLSLCLVYS